MAKFNKIAVLTRMGTTGMIPVFYHENVEVAKKVPKACYEGGVRAFKFTNRGDSAQEVFAGIVEFAARECPEMAMGVGSVVNPATAASCIQSGADSVVGPLFNPGIAKVCNRRLIAYAPGCDSVSGVGFTQEAGRDPYKIFPGNVYGPNFVKGLMTPMPWSRLMVTGGAEPARENLTFWFKAGAFCVGIGSKLFPKDKVTAGDWGYVIGRYAEALAYIAETRRQVKLSGVFFTADYTDSHRFLIVLIRKINR